jgi:hypothetical protein
MCLEVLRKISVMIAGFGQNKNPGSEYEAGEFATALWYGNVE